MVISVVLNLMPIEIEIVWRQAHAKVLNFPSDNNLHLDLRTWLSFPITNSEKLDFVVGVGFGK